MLTCNNNFKQKGALKSALFFILIERHYLFFAFFLLIFLASSAGASSVRLGIGALHFFYEETDENGNRLNTEQGYIPGAEVAFELPIANKWAVEPELRWYQGEVEYDGFTQLGAPLKTETKEKLLFLGAKLFRNVGRGKDVFLGVTRVNWNRDIQPTGNVSGLEENYEWNEINFGIRHQFLKTDKNLFSYRLMGLYLVDPIVTVDLGDLDAGNVKLHQDNSVGFRGSFTWAHELGRNYHIGANILVETWELRESETRLIDTNLGALFIVEPESISFHTSANVFITVDF